MAMAPSAVILPETMPLRTLITLLNYENMVSNPMFKNVRLLKASIADPLETEVFMSMQKTGYPKLPSSVLKQNIYFFDQFEETTAPQHPSTICEIHPEASPLVKALSFQQREFIYHQTRAFDSCFQSCALLEEFLKLAPPGQQLSIQFKDEKAVLVDPAQRVHYRCILNQPKQSMITCIHGDKTGLDVERNRLLGCCVRDGNQHVYMVFPAELRDPDNPAELDFIAVDMTRMQYGESGRGIFGENYYLGPARKYIQSFFENVAGKGSKISLINNPRTAQDTENVVYKRLKICAQKVLQRWENRHMEGWCDFCGKEGKGLLFCGGCRTETPQIRYCCKEHQVSGWKLHKFTCKKTKKSG